MAGSFHPVSPDEEIGTEETFERPRRDWEELVLLHRITVDDVARLKGRQWLTAAACAVPRAISRSCGWRRNLQPVASWTPRTPRMWSR